MIYVDIKNKIWADQKSHYQKNRRNKTKPYNRLETNKKNLKPAEGFR